MRYDSTKYGQPGKTTPLQILEHYLRHKFGWW